MLALKNPCFDNEMNSIHAEILPISTGEDTMRLYCRHMLLPSSIDIGPWLLTHLGEQARICTDQLDGWRGRELYFLQPLDGSRRPCFIVSLSPWLLFFGPFMIKYSRGGKQARRAGSWFHVQDPAL